MDSKQLLIALSLLSLAGFAYKLKQPAPLFGHGQIKVPAGLIVAKDPPKQIAIDKAESFRLLDARVTPLAKFEFNARVISLEWYSDRESTYSPVDLGIGWGKMSDSANIDAMDWSHGSRFLMYRWASKPPIASDEIIRSMANIHIVPANPYVLSKVSKLKFGQRVQGSGMLVRLDGDDGFYWTSSLTRDDTGNGACEVLYLESIDAY
jgi:hypothetical protein